MEQHIKKYLRGLGHRLHPVVMIADQGLKETVITATHEALDAHELIKVKIRGDDRERRAVLIDELCRQTGAELIARIGFTALLFRRNADHPKLDLSQAQ
ncbi:MAG: YhbY family RNA-binding protein [Thiotrichales bacterium]